MLEDETRDAEFVQRALREGGFDFSFRRVETESEFRDALEHFQPSVILSDHGLPAFDGFTALALAQKKYPEAPFIFVTGSLGEEMVIRALKSGAADFVLKSHLTTLPPAVHRALDQVDLKLQRKRTEEALQSSEERYRSLVEISPDALLVEADDKIVFINSAGLKLFKAGEAAEIIGKPALQFFHPDDREIVRQQMHALLKEHQAIPFTEYRVLRSDGSVVEVEIAAAPLSFEGKASAQIILHDVSDRKLAEEEIRRLNLELEQRVVERTAELESANKELEAFSYSVSHDLRAPLRHIEGFVEIFRATKGPVLDKEAQNYLQTIAEAAKQMGRLIDDLLAFSRTARAELRKTRINLNEIVRNVLREVELDASERMVEWQIDHLPPAEGDASLIHQVFLNLISNALKYTRPRKRARIEVGAKNEEGEIILFVKDNGVGFDMRYVHKLFSVFQRLHRATDFEGTGIGLANVRRIVSRHGGRTWAEGAVDTGAAFYFTLPRIRTKRKTVA